MTRYKARDIEVLRKCMKEPRRLVGYTVRTLASEVGANRTTIGYMLTGERPYVDETVAQRIAEVLGHSLGDLFEPSEFASENEDACATCVTMRGRQDEERPP
jgi:DNA-binding XRE family transcriptional regulator